MDGVAGARNDLAFSPSVDIANGAPSGTDATNQIVLTWADGTLGLNNEQLLMMTSTDGGTSFSGPTAVPLTAGDRPYYTAPAISPNGTDVYITYNAFTTPYRNDTSSSRGLVGAILHADVTGGTIGSFGTLTRGTVGDPRGSSQNDLTRPSSSATTSTPRPPARARWGYGTTSAMGRTARRSTPVACRFEAGLRSPRPLRRPTARRRSVTPTSMAPRSPIPHPEPPSQPGAPQPAGPRGLMAEAARGDRPHADPLP